MKIAIIYGGKSGEHEISLISAASVVRNIDSAEKIILIAVTKDGKWFLQSEEELKRVRAFPDSALEIKTENAQEVFAVPGGGHEKTFVTESGFISVDVVFPVLHGTFGEDGTIQGLLELINVPYVGAAVLASAITMDKEKTKVVLAHAGIPIVPYLCMRRSDAESRTRYDEFLSDAQEKLGFPLFVKPCSAGSSDGASRANDLRHLNGAILEAFFWDDKILIEKAIDAQEIECSVTGNPITDSGMNNFEKLNVFGPGEVSPKHEFYDYDAKYNDPEGADLLIPARIEESKRMQIRELAEKAYRVLDLNGLARVDFFVDKRTEKIYLNEINTMPGFTKISMFPKLCEHDGLPFKQLTRLLIEEAFARFKDTRKLTTSR